MIVTTTPIPRSCSVARPIMKDSHSFDSGSNPDGSIILISILSHKASIPLIDRMSANPGKAPQFDAPPIIVILI